LGRGLAALIGDVGAESTIERARNQRRVPIEHIRPNPRNPRRHYSDVELDELAASIKERGIIQPVVVRAVRGARDAYEIIAGERRWRAAQRAGLHEVPVVIIEATDDESLQLAIIENVQRADLNPLEEADGYRALVEDHNHTQDDIAKMVGKSRSHVANTLRLLKLPPSIRGYIFKGKLDAGHARMLIGGAWVDSASGAALMVENPARRTPIAFASAVVRSAGTARIGTSRTRLAARRRVAAAATIRTEPRSTTLGEPTLHSTDPVGAVSVASRAPDPFQCGKVRIRRPRASHSQVPMQIAQRFSDPEDEGSRLQAYVDATL